MDRYGRTSRHSHFGTFPARLGERSVRRAAPGEGSWPVIPRRVLSQQEGNAVRSNAAQRVYGSRGATRVALDPDWSQLKQDVAAWRRDDRQRVSPLADYARFLAWQDGPDDDLARAFAFFLPVHATPPDGPHWAMLGALAMQPMSPNPFDLAVAWTAGWRGDREVGPFARSRVGELAGLALIEQVELSVHTSLRLLSAQTGLAVVESDEITSTAAAITMSLLGACDCGHHLRGCGGTCGRGCCFPDHDLRTWDARACHLRPFIDQAVRGTARRRILGGAFAEGMLFRMLESEGRMLCRTVEWGRCEICGRAFEGTRCPEPHQEPSRPVRREPRKNQLIVPARSTGMGHVPIQRWWCPSCQHLHGSAGMRRRRTATCPRCGSTCQESRAVWTLAATARVVEACTS
jgi:hypothetical protein